MRFQENLIRARKARGLSQEGLAAAVGVSRQAVSKWETGDAMPDLSKLVALADALEVSLDDLCGRERVSPRTMAEGPDAAPPAPAETAAARAKRPWPVPALCGFLLAALLAGGLWVWSQRDVEQASEAPAYTALPEKFTVSGVTFTLGGTEDRRTLGYCFTPAAYKAGWTYQITFTTGAGLSKTFDTDYQSGVCAGEVFLAMYEDYSVTASVVDEKGNSRNIVVALDLSISKDRVSWLPVEG